MGWLSRIGQKAARPLAPAADEAALARTAMLDMSEAARMQRAREQEWRGKFKHTFDAVHSTTADFDAFDPSKLAQLDPGWRGRAHYFKELTPEFKERMSDSGSSGFGYRYKRGGAGFEDDLNSKPVIIGLYQPFTDALAGNPKIAAAFAKAGYKAIGRDARTGKPLSVLKPGLRSDYDKGGKYMGYDESKKLMETDAPEFTAAAKKLGYDGFKWEGEIGVFPGHENQIRLKWAAFDPSQSGSSKLLAAVPAAIGGGLLSRWAMMQNGDQYT